MLGCTIFDSFFLQQAADKNVKRRITKWCFPTNVWPFLFCQGFCNLLILAINFSELYSTKVCSLLFVTISVPHFVVVLFQLFCWFSWINLAIKRDKTLVLQLWFLTEIYYFFKYKIYLDRFWLQDISCAMTRQLCEVLI